MPLLQRPIYLHFLNRELLRAAAFSPPQSYPFDSLSLILMCTAQRLYASFSSIWENEFIAAPSVQLLAELFELDQLGVISDSTTREEHVARRQMLYAFDKERYPGYFGAKSMPLHSFRPTEHKENDTTRTLAASLLGWAQEDMLPHRWADAKAMRTLSPIKKDVARIIERRQGAAVTLSLLGGKLRDRKQAFLPPLAQLLSLLYIEDHLDAMDLDIATGVPGFEYFDRVSRSFPHLDVGGFARVVRWCGFEKAACQKVATGESYSLRGTAHHKVACEIVCRVIRAASRLVSRPAPQRLLRPAFYAALDDLPARIACRDISGSDRWPEVMLGRLHKLDAALSRCRVWAPHWLVEKQEMDASGSRILVVTANDTEARILREMLVSRFNRNFSREYIKDHTLHNFGDLDNLQLVHVQTEMGTEAPGAATLTLVDVVDAVKPEAVLLIGICAGLRENDHNIGDVIVSRQIRLFDPKKVIYRDNAEIPLYRGDKVSSSTRLLDRARSAALDWDGGAVHFGLVLTGNTMVNSPDTVAQLKQFEPEAIGYEMEAGGLYATCYKRKTDWLVIKGICDWGHDKSDDFQREAARRAVEFFTHMLAIGALHNA